MCFDSQVLSCEAWDALTPADLADQYFSGLGISPQDYCTRIKRMVRKFDREDAYREHLVEQLHSLKKAGSDDIEALERCVFSLRAFLDNATISERSSSWLLDVLFEYIPEDMLRFYNMDLRRGGITRKPSASSLARFLQDYLESMVDTKDQKRKTKDKKETLKVQDSANSTTKTPISCDYCKGKHLVHMCVKFNALTAKERRTEVEKYGGCFICLRAGHT